MHRHPATGTLLADFLRDTADRDVASVVTAVAASCVPIAETIRRGILSDLFDAPASGRNADGDAQRPLDILADERILWGVAGSGVRSLFSEERHGLELVDPDGTLLLAVDPLDGSSNIETNVSVGTIFSVLPAPAGEAMVSDFLRTGHAQKAAGFVIYGPQTSMVFTTGNGTHVATFDPDAGAFRITRVAVVIPASSPEYAINASNYRYWHAPVRAFVDDCIEGADGPRGKNFNMRWIASLVADAYRILVRGGVFLYPGDSRRGYERGRLRQLYEANPIAFVVEQAGGFATDGVSRMLDIVPGDLHQRVPLIFGSTEKVERIRRYHLEIETNADRSPLFGRRGLLRV
jgi:fructose-1,6-bisphosphatase I